MDHSKKFEMVKKYYIHKMWNETKVRNAVNAGWITSAEFEEITGKKYQ